MAKASPNPTDTARVGASAEEGGLLIDERAFREWLEANGQSPATAASRLSNARRVEARLGDLALALSERGKDDVMAQFQYSAEDERRRRPNPSPVPIEGELRTGLASLRSSIDLYARFLEARAEGAGTPAHPASGTRFSRAGIEAAMDASDRRDDAGGRGAFASFQEPSRYWVRSTRPRSPRIYPSKAIAGFLLGRGSDKLNGGWSASSNAAARLHAAGYVIVDQSDVPLPLPDEYPHLMRGADRARLVALNYFIEPAREAGQASVQIRAGDLHDLAGLKQNWANVCQALEGEKFQQMAQVPAPRAEGPQRSTTTTYTFDLPARPDVPTPEPTMPDAEPPAPSPDPVNLILYGPPGTGKTYSTAAEAVRLCGEEPPEDRAELMEVYQRLLKAGRIEFVTFHQSMSYEDFVEGRQPMTGGEGDAEGAADDASGGFRLVTVAGLFRRIAKRALSSRARAPAAEAVRLEGRRIFKMSIGNSRLPEDAPLFDEAIAGGYAVLGFKDIDWSDERFSSREAIL
ncbi:MAG: hypothetical protein ACU0DT_00170, partial [Albimonas sp.]